MHVGREDADRAASGEPVRRSFGERFRLVELLAHGQGIETWRGVDPEGGEVLIKSLPAAALSAATRSWIALQTEVLNRSSGLLEGGGGHLHCGIDGDSFFLARPFVRGRTLKERLDDSPLAVRDAIALAIHLLGDLEELHARGMVHGDLKPSNIVLPDPPLSSPVLVDFGLIRHLLLAGTAEEDVLDTVLYLAPEQSGLLERGVDHRADLHALGLVMFEAIAGHRTVSGRNVSELLRRQLAADPPPLDSLVPAAPRGLGRIVARLLRRDARDRYQTARGVRADLEDLAAALDRGDANPDLVIGTRDARDAVIEPAFIGRTGEMAELERALASAREGNGGLTLVEGASGAGKTWLLEEFARRTAKEATWVLHGHGEGQVPEHPFPVLSGLARQIATTAAGTARAERLVAGARSVARVLAELLPELRGLFGMSAARTPPAPTSPEPKDEDRSVAALSLLIDALGSSDETALLLLDDGQWADGLTRRLLERWQARPAGADGESGGSGRRYVLVVLALRSDAPGEEDPERNVRPLARIRLGSFGSDEVREQVVSMARELPDRAVGLVIEHAAGSPFLGPILLQGLVEYGALMHTPRGWQLIEDRVDQLRVSGRLSDPLAARIAPLPAPDRRLLGAGALLGRTFDPVVAAQLGEIEQGEAVRLVQELRGRLIWLDRSGARCIFPHERIREALLAQLPETERRQLHLAAAELIEAADGDHEFELAYHYDAAGEPGRALHHAIEAAERAQAQHDLELAERHYRVAARGLAQDTARSTRFRAIRGLGDVLLARAAYDESGKLLDEAEHLAPDAAARADIEERRTLLALEQGDPKRAAEHGERALRLIGRFVPKWTAVCAADMLWQLAVQFLHTRFRRLFVGRRAPDGSGRDRWAIRLYHGLTAPYFLARGAVWALWAHLHELNLSERHAPSNALGRAYGMHGAICSRFPRFFERAVRYARIGAGLCRERGDVAGEARAIQFLAIGLCESGRYHEAIEAADQSARLFEWAGEGSKANGPLGWGALARFRRGDLAGALRASQRLLERARAFDDANGVAFAVDTWARVTGGQVPAEVLHRELDRQTDDVQTTALVAQAEAIRLLGAGEAGAAERLLESWLRRLRKRRAFLQEPNVSMLVYLVAALRQQALQAPPMNPRRRARILARARRASRRALAQARRFRNSEPHACREAGLIAAMSGAPGRALALVERSMRAAERLDARLELALSREARGELGLALGQAGATEELEHARRELAAIGAPLAATEPAPITIPPERLRSVLEAGQEIARARTPAAVYQSLRDGALALLPGQLCAVLEPSGAVLHGDAVPVSQDMLQEALKSRRPVVRPAGQLTIAGDATLGRAAARSALSAPIMAREGVAALLYLTHAHASESFGDDARQLTGFATALAGAALENAAVVQQVQELARELERRVDARTAELARANADLAQGLRRLEGEQRQLLHAGRMAAIGTLIAGLAHELNNPLTVILGNVEHLIRLLPPVDDDLARRLADAIERQTRRAASIVRALLGFSRPQPEQRQLVSPRELVRTVAELVGPEARRREIELRVTIPDELPAILGSPQHIESALVNIAINALQATPERGLVEISVAAEALTGAPGIAFAVRDSGPGISPDVLPQIFDPFFTTKPAGQGTGLGLSLALEAVNAQGGRLEVESALGAGTTMWLWLPASSENSMT